MILEYVKKNVKKDVSDKNISVTEKIGWLLINLIGFIFLINIDENIIYSSSKFFVINGPFEAKGIRINTKTSGTELYIFTSNGEKFISSCLGIRDILCDGKEYKFNHEYKLIFIPYNTCGKKCYKGIIKSYSKNENTLFVNNKLRKYILSNRIFEFIVFLIKLDLLLGVLWASYGIFLAKRGKYE